jgi:hypothetical protein
MARRAIQTDNKPGSLIQCRSASGDVATLEKHKEIELKELVRMLG